MAAKKKAKLVKKKVSKRVQKKTSKMLAVKKAVAQNEIKFHYLKPQGFRNVYADGFFGGVTPAGKIHLTAFSERQPIPKVSYLTFDKYDESGYMLGDEILEKREGLDGNGTYLSFLG